MTKCPECGGPCTMRSTFDCKDATSMDFYSTTVNADHVLLPREPPWPKVWVAMGVRTENGKRTDVVLTYTEEGGGWYQWTQAPGGREAKHFKTAKAAVDAAMGCPGPWFYEPEKSTIHAEPVDGLKAVRYRKLIAEAEAECAK